MPPTRLFEETSQPRTEGHSKCSFTFPYGDHAPPLISQAAFDARVSLDVLIELRLPEVDSAFGCVGEPALGMAVPEASVNEDHGPPARKHNVRAPRQVATMKPEPEAECVKNRPHDSFRRGVTSADPAHVPAAMLGSNTVNHQTLRTS